MINPIPDRLKGVWDEWNIRGIILVSLSLQTILILFAPFRKRIPKKPVMLLIWSSYLLADWAASFAIGHIANSNGNKGDKSHENADLLAFWAPFLLLHLGGPDPITAFSLEDNELWLRHLFSLLVQVVVTGYVFLLTLPENKLLVPTLLMFLAGIIKYFERTRALFGASLDRFRESMLKAPDAGPNYAKLMEEYTSKKEAGLPTRIEMTPEPGKDSKPANKAENTDKAKELTELDVVRYAYKHFQIFKGLIVELIFSFRERNESREFFRGIDAEHALKIIDLELNFIYEALYTKVVVVHSTTGYIFRAISVGSVVAACVKFHYLNKHCFTKFDVNVTYALLVGAICLDFIALLMLISSYWTMAAINNNKRTGKLVLIAQKYLNMKKISWFEDPENKEKVLGTFILFRRWSESVSCFNLVSYCLRLRPYPVECCLPFIYKVIDKVTDYLGAREFINEWWYVSSRRLPRKLWEFVFAELHGKSEDAEDLETTKRICSARGAYVIQEGQWKGGDAQVYQKITEDYIENVTFDESLLLWHVATELCFQDTQNQKEKDYKQFSKLLSDYMVYLLVMRPTMMSAVAGIGQIRFRDTCAEAEKFFSRRTLEKGQVNEACRKLLDVDTKVKPVHVKGDRSKSILFDACMLAKELNKLDNDNKDNDEKWKIISKVWVEMLSYAATHCRPATHAQQVSKGGQLISFVWLLMAHFGLGEQFQINEGHARAKLIVGK
ncbi:hypothetical protein RGQ29_024327 [Quercus rubra]|uniref:DUF4220 domain-containing protein n=1 Tax=Quercus rubra TaxID=3512 RepID=A0AAN7EW16_QUERU|nr:hypothetical protein RGQ29_024327 [Quercus rubra]